MHLRQFGGDRDHEHAAVGGDLDPRRAHAAGPHQTVSPAAALVGPSGSLSDRNVLFVAQPANGFVGRAATADKATLADWRTVAGNDGASRGEDPRFVSATNLHIDPTVPTPVEGIGSFFGGAISWVADDVDGNPRAATPDAGADEGAFIPLDLYDIQALAVLAPSGALVAGTTFTPQASFFNKGVQSLTNVPVRFRIVGPAPAADTVYNQSVVFPSFPTATTQTVSFPAVALPLAGDYTLEAVSELASDVRPVNNRATGSFSQTWSLVTLVTGSGTLAKSPNRANQGTRSTDTGNTTRRS